MKIFGIHFAPLRLPLHRRLETLALCLASFLIITLPILSILFTVYLCFTRFWWIAAASVAWTVIDRDTPEQGGRPKNFIRSSGIFKYAADYFPIRTKLAPGFTIDPKLNYLCGWFPHGFLPLGVPYGLTRGYGEEFAKHTIKSMTINCNFYIPFFRDFLLSIGMLKASPKGINYALGDPAGGNVVLLPVGGSHEALYFKTGEYRITLKNRKGFIKLALRNGTPVIPVFSFGENAAWNQVIFKDDSPVRRLQIWLRKKTNFAFVVLLGRGIFQYSFGMLPFRNPINIVFGLPIHFGKIENPSQNEIDEAHQKFTKALVDIFEKYKYDYEANPEKCRLIID